MKHLALWLVVVCLASGEAPPAKKLNVKDTAEWICGLFEVKNGHIFVATRDLDHLYDIRYRLPAGSEIKPLGGGFSPDYRGIIIDQSDLYPVEIHCAKFGLGEYDLCINSPFLYLMDSPPSDIDPASRDHPKAALITEADFRPIAESIHSHFSRITGLKPHALRLQSEDGWPSEHYVWISDRFTTLLSIYQANDHIGLHVKVKKPEDDLQKLQQRRKGKEEPFKGWGELIGTASKQ